jgi:hypothetical protein
MGIGQMRNSNKNSIEIKKTDYNSETLRSLSSLPHMIIGNEN